MRDSQVFAGDFGCLLVGQAGVLGSLSLLIPVPELSDVAVVIGLHLMVEDLRLAVARLADQIAIEQSKDFVTDALQLALHLGAILFCPARLLGVLLALFLLLHTAD